MFQDGIPWVLEGEAALMADQPTPRTTLTAHHHVTAWCLNCGHALEIDLPELITAGHGDSPCSSCPCAVRGAARGGSSSRSPGRRGCRHQGCILVDFYTLVHDHRLALLVRGRQPAHQPPRATGGVGIGAAPVSLGLGPMGHKPPLLLRRPGVLMRPGRSPRDCDRGAESAGCRAPARSCIDRFGAPAA